MAESLDVDALRHGLSRISAQMEAASGELNQLDGQLGDGDLGVTLVRGMRAIDADLATLPDDVGAAFSKCAQAFTRTSGSTFGTLLATGLLAAARVGKGKRQIPWRDLSGVLDAAMAAIAARGKAQLGDKTVLDALDAIRRAVEGCEDPSQMLASSLMEVRSALDRLRSQPARQGRARIFADRTIGTDDPGMVAVLRILEGLA